MTRFQPAALPLRLSISVTDGWQVASLIAFLVACIAPVGLALTGRAPAMANAVGGSAGVVAGITMVAGSAATALAAVTVGVLFGAPLGEARRRVSGRLGTLIEVGTLLPLLLPPAAFALGVRSLLQTAGLESLIRGNTSIVLSAVPVVLAQTCITTSIVAVAWSASRARRSRAERQHIEDAALLIGLSPFDRWWAAERPEALRALAAGAALAFLHAFTSAAAPAVFPDARVPNLTFEVLRGTSGGVRAVATLVPILVTMPLLWLAVRRARSSNGRVGDDTRMSASWASIGLALVASWVLVPLAAVIARGAMPEAIVALSQSADGLALTAAFGASLLLAIAAAGGALIPLAFASTSAPSWLRTGFAPWMPLALAPAALGAGASEWFATHAWLASAALVHLVLGYCASLPVIRALGASAAGAGLDAGRVVGADGLQPLFRGARPRFERMMLGAVTLGVLASLADVASIPLGRDEAARSLGAAFPALLAAPGVAAAGAYTLATAFIGATAAGAAIVLHTDTGTYSAWARR